MQIVTLATLVVVALAIAAVAPLWRLLHRVPDLPLGAQRRDQPRGQRDAPPGDRR